MSEVEWIRKGRMFRTKAASGRRPYAVSVQVLAAIRDTEVVRPIRNRHRYTNPTFSSHHKFQVLPSWTALQLQPKVNQHFAEGSVLPR